MSSLKGILTALAFTFISSSFAEVKLARIFGDHMVLQANKPIRIWGTANPNEVVKVEIDGKIQNCTTNQNGKWLVAFKEGKGYGGPYTINVKSNQNELILKDVLFGEVWLCSGQSNMAFAVARSGDSKQDISESNQNQIRLFKIDKDKSPTPLNEFRNQPSWAIASPKSVRTFSAVGYYFGKRLFKDLQVPIGLISSGAAGSTIVSFLDEETAQKTAHQEVLKAEDKRYLESQKRQEIAAKKKGKKPHGISHRVSSWSHNAMIKPLEPLSLAGIIWYQGETEVLSGERTVNAYADWFASYLMMMRNNFQDSTLPAYLVQLPGYGKNDGVNLWAKFRQIQEKKLLKLPNTSLATAFDLGDETDLHPTNKKPVGQRLALCALGKTYGKSVEFEGPKLTSIQKHGSKISVTLSNVLEGLSCVPEEPIFTVLLTDGSTQNIKAHRSSSNGFEFEVDSNTQVERVQYAFENTPKTAIYNSEGLPLLPFDVSIPFKQ